MKVAFIAAGAGGMYCGSCIHDNALAAELQRQGIDVLLQPIYTPLRSDETSVANERVYYGAVNIYLQQLSTLFSKLPRFVRRTLDHPALLRRLSTSRKVTDAKALGALTLSMLSGEKGKQKAELDRLVKWLADDFQPDIVHLANSMLLGLARSLRTAMPDVRIVCSVQGEDIFLDDLQPPYRDEVIDTLRERAAECDAFVSTSEFYRHSMSELLDVPLDRLHAARLGISLDGYPTNGNRNGKGDGPFVVGYLARQCPEKGLHHLVDAYGLLVERYGTDGVKLKVAGYVGGRDADYVADLKSRAVERGWDAGIEWIGEVDREHKIDLLRSLDVFSVPTDYVEPKGLSILEAMACGIPVVQPNHGSFPEILEMGGGGVLVEPGSSQALAGAIADLLDDREAASALGRQGQASVQKHFTVVDNARELVEIYRQVLADGAGRHG